MSGRRGTSDAYVFLEVARRLDASIQEQDRLILRAYATADPRFLVRAVEVRNTLVAHWGRLWKRGTDPKVQSL